MPERPLIPSPGLCVVHDARRSISDVRVKTGRGYRHCQTVRAVGAEGIELPKIVDHEVRRQELVEAAWRVINRVGIDATTIREIAAESGYSTGSLAHYFREQGRHPALGARAGRQRHPGTPRAMPPRAHVITRLRHALAQALPCDDRRAFELTLDVNFWARALNQPSLRALQHRDHDVWRDVVMTLVAEAQAGEGDRPTRSRPPTSPTSSSPSSTGSACRASSTRS